MRKYLEAKRNLWNTYFIDQPYELNKCSYLDEYEEIDKLIFSALVLKNIRREMPDNFIFGKEAFHFINVILRDKIDRINIMTCTVDKDRKIWSKPYEIILNKKYIFNFIEYFEWNRYGFVTYPYTLVKIIQCDNNPGLENKEALIETVNVDIFFIDL